MNIQFAESTSEQAAVDCLKDFVYSFAFGSEIAYDRSICTLASLRDSLPPKLMRGEVRMKEVG